MCVGENKEGRNRESEGRMVGKANKGVSKEDDEEAYISIEI